MRKKILIGLVILGLGVGSYAIHKSFKPKATCNPNGTCNACTTCNYCNNCAKNGGSCSVCN